jgi:HAD superfamily hydrolase (TIGR01509 family)
MAPVSIPCRPQPDSGSLRADVDTLLLDVDGTLIDSNGAHAESWVQALHEHGIAADPVTVRSLIGMGGDKLLPRVARLEEDSSLGVAIGQRKKQLFMARLPVLQATHGARALLQYLRQNGIDLAVATSADDSDMDALLKQAQVSDLVPARASSDDAAESKPDPDIVRAALARVDVGVQTAVLLGDTPYDIEAAERAGIRCVVLRCGGFWSDHDLVGAMAIFDDPAELLSEMQRVTPWNTPGRSA